ncbi:restriction endonuclease subunit S [Elizabethkingia bruuniana]|uniref:restriction endonuclease subunit S n=1 Tax=Elizabethkingia bruuniana TaxID=1756149 RepID=UPI0020139C5C|nr:restriction endonuclease subunit S [Elizabethkingia bruuniana]MCL1636363.1 restriction endonuclease subunit S [Elizabethkingia bruuniana]
MTEENKSVKKFPNSGNIPKLRFFQFNNEWKNEKLGNLMTFKVTNSYSRDNLNYESGAVKNIHYGDIHTKFQTLFDLEKENVPYINEDISLSRISEDFYCQEGDIIFADASEDLNDVGKSIEITNLNDEKLLSGLHTLLARPQEDIFFKGFLGYLLKSNNVRNQIKREAQGSKVLSINVGRISNIHLPFPSILEQQKISEFLSLLDKRILYSMKIIEGLITLKIQSRNKLFKQIIKDDYEAFMVEEILNYEQPTKYIVSNTDYSSDKSLIPVLTANKAFILGYTNEDWGIYNKGKCIVLDDFTLDLKYVDFSFKIKSSAIKLLTPKNNIDLKFVFEYFSFLNLSSNEHKRHYISEIQPMLLNIPSIDIQNNISNFLLKLDAKINLETELLNQFENQKKYLLQNLFV